MWIKQTPEEIAVTRQARRRGWSRGSLLFGSIIFLLVLFTNGRHSRSGQFFVAGYLYPRRLGISIIAGIVCGLFHRYFDKKVPTVVCPKCGAVKYQDECLQCKCGGHFENIEEMKWQKEKSK
jgi:hypothetical protein